MYDYYCIYIYIYIYIISIIKCHLEGARDAQDALLQTKQRGVLWTAHGVLDILGVTETRITDV